MIMKNNINRLTLLLLVLLGGVGFTSCSDDDNDFIELPTIEMPQSEAGPVSIDYREILDAGSYVYDYTIKLDKPAATTLLCDIAVDESMVEAYNAANNTSYKMMPAFVYELQAKNAIVKAGQQESNSLSVKFSSLFGLVEGEEYLLPIVATIDETCVGQFVTDTRSVSYFTISIDGELDYIPGLNMSSYSTDMYRTLSFANDEVVTIEDNTHTFEMLVYPYNWHSGTNYIGTWRGKDTNNNNEVFSGCELRVTGATGASNIGNRQCDLTLANQNIMLPANQWVRLTITCDGTKTGQNIEIAYRLYINGEEVASAKPTKRWGPSSSQRFKVADNPAGPFKDALGKPLIDKFVNGAQPIDQFVYKDDDGQYYMYYGGWGHCNMVKLAPDLLSIVPFEDGTLYKEVTPEKYVEGPFMLKRNGKYYFMWSEGGWTGPDYCVAYAIADSPFGPFKREAKILQRDPNIGTGAGHHSVVKGPGEDEWYIIYHRHPLGETDGNARVTCVDRMYFDKDGKIKPIKMTFEGVKASPLK